MWLLGKERMQQLSPVLNSGYYTKWITYLERLFRYSRNKEYYSNPVNILGLQIALAKQLRKAEKLVTEGYKLRDEADQKGDKELAKKLSIGISQNHQIARVIKVIADGLAWRVLDFDRPFLRVMAEGKKLFGSVDLLSKQYENVEKTAMRFVENRGSRILLSDITHFLRQGDLVELGNRTIIWELKKSGKVAKSVYTIANQPAKNAVSKQLKRVIQAQIVRDYRKIAYGGQTINIIDIPIKYRHHLVAIRKLIAIARKNLFAFGEFGNYLTVECVDNEALVNQSIKTGKRLWETNPYIKKPNWSKSDTVIPYTNFDSFYDDEGDFFRTSTPYSAYPFSNHDCICLFSGKLMLKSMLNISEIKRIFVKNEWEVIDIDVDDNIKSAQDVIPHLYQSERFYEHSVNIAAFEVRRDPFRLRIPLSWVIKIASEFMDPQVLVDKADYIYKTSSYGIPRLFEPFIIDERNAWK